MPLGGPETVQDDKLPDAAYTEEKMNLGIREKQLPEKFATPEYQVLLVAEKFQTGFDQPVLHTMFVDKRLAGKQAVQTLSCLNRTHPLKEDTFVLDFVNDHEEIREAFKTYYEGAEMGQEVDPDRMYVIKADLETAGRRSESSLFAAPCRRRWKHTGSPHVPGLVVHICDSRRLPPVEVLEFELEGASQPVQHHACPFVRKLHALRVGGRIPRDQTPCAQ